MNPFIHYNRILFSILFMISIHCNIILCSSNNINNRQETIVSNTMQILPGGILKDGNNLTNNSSRWTNSTHFNNNEEADFRRQVKMAEAANLDWIAVNVANVGGAGSSARPNGQRLLQRLLDETQQTFLQPAASSSQNPTRGICLWNCNPNKQNTTNLLLFSQAGNSDEPDTRITKLTSTSDLKKSGFMANRPTILMVHGFRGSGLTRQVWAIDLKDLILARERSNVLFADWSHHAHVISYLHALEHIEEVTQDLYSIFENLEAAFPRFRMKDIHVIGHSLGSHIAGLLGQMMDGEMNQITALDPTGFLLSSSGPNLKLTQDDAKYVSAYHTNAKYLGTEMNLADRDVFFNGGNDQPACKSIASKLIPGACSHRQAVKYASTFMNKCMMVAYVCKDYDKFLSGECGFCGANSDSCAAIGHESQYATLSGPLRPRKLDKKKIIGDQPWLDGQSSPRYHIKMGAERPYCMFTYQVVVKFTDSSNLDDVSSFDLLLRVSDRATDNKGVWVHITNRLRPDARLEVFAGTGKEKQITVSGRYLFTGLAFVERGHELYDQAPVKFTEVSLANPFKDKLVGQPKVYVNFMSNSKFEVRATSSGPVERINFVNLEQVQSNREPRVESRLDRGAGSGLLRRQQHLHQSAATRRHSSTSSSKLRRQWSLGRDGGRRKSSLVAWRSRHKQTNTTIDHHDDNEDNDQQ